MGEKDFDAWADGYDASVEQSDEEGSYPFAGYERVLGTIERRVLAAGARRVLDVGFGTGTLTARLYDAGCEVWGEDFSGRMVELAQGRMPGAHLFQGDFSGGVADEIRRRRYDAIVATYSLHHLDDAGKVALLRQLVGLLAEGGRLYVGDVAFATRAELEACRAEAGERWDSDEVYFVYDELRDALPGLTFERMSPCAGLLTLGA
nr:class I SAM-dependent methyltransferase [Olsenella profusa]